MRRVWWPLFFNLLNAAGANGYVVHRAIIKRPLDHRKFLLAVSKELREEGFKKSHYLHFTGLEGLQRMNWPKESPQGILRTTEYTRVKVARAYYRACLREGTKGVRDNRDALLPIDSNARRPSGNVKRSVTGCHVCRVPLCNNEYCWNR
jgi:hypothetical protein